MFYSLQLASKPVPLRCGTCSPVKQELLDTHLGLLVTALGLTEHVSSEEDLIGAMFSILHSGSSVLTSPAVRSACLTSLLSHSVILT